MSPPPTTYRRTLGARARGILAHALLFGGVGAVAAIFAAVGAARYSNSGPAAIAAGVVVLLGFIAGGVVTVRRELRLRLELHGDQLVLHEPNGHARTLAYRDIRALRVGTQGDDMVCTLVAADGTHFALPPAVADFRRIAAGLDELVLPTVLATHVDELERGRTLELADDPRRAAIRSGLRLAESLAQVKSLVTGDLLGLGRSLLASYTSTDDPDDALPPGTPGLVVSRGGVASARAPARVVPWHAIACARCNRHRLLVETRNGQSFGATWEAERFLPLAAWVAEQARQGGRG